jgi:hypothetical protein
VTYNHTSMPTWKDLYQAALIETDTHQMLVRIKQAERAILDRVEELLISGEDAERGALSDALTAMRHLRRLYERSGAA